MEFKNLLFEVAGRVATVTFNRPSALNALNDDTLVDLDNALTEIEKMQRLKASFLQVPARLLWPGLI